MKNFFSIAAFFRSITPHLKILRGALLCQQSITIGFCRSVGLIIRMKEKKNLRCGQSKASVSGHYEYCTTHMRYINAKSLLHATRSTRIKQNNRILQFIFLFVYRTVSSPQKQFSIWKTRLSGCHLSPRTSLQPNWLIKNVVQCPPGTITKSVILFSFV